MKEFVLFNSHQKCLQNIATDTENATYNFYSMSVEADTKLFAA